MRTVLLVFVIVPLACVLASDPVPADRPIAPPSKALEPKPGDAPPLTVQMSWCEAAGCALTFTFSAPVPDAKLAFSPAQAGTTTWKTPTELVFTPAKGAMLAGHAITAAIPEASFTQNFEVPFFEAAGKVARWAVEPGKPRFVAFLNGYSLQLGRGPLFVLFDQPVDPDAIGKGVVVKSGGKRISVAVRRPTSTAQIYDRPIDRALLVTLELDHLPPDGEAVTIDLPSRDDAGATITHTARLQVNTTLTASGFTTEGDDGVSKGRRTPLYAEWTIPFSNQVTSLALDKHVSIEPKPKSMHAHVWGVKGIIRAELEPGVLYRLAIDDDLHDVLGNRLREPVVARFRAADAAPSFALPSEALVLEAGHARLPIQLMNAGDIQVTAQKFATVQDWLAARRNGGTCSGNPQPVGVDSPLNQKVTRDIRLEPGLFCVSATAHGRGSEGKTVELAATTFVDVTALGATAKVFDGHVFAWLTRLADGKPAGGTRVAIVDDAGAELAAAPAAADGTVQLDTELATATGLTGKAYLVAGDLVAPLEDATLSHARNFGLDGRVPDAAPLVASLFTERGTYRPGETVHVKAVVRDPISHRVQAGTLEFAIRDPRGEQVATAAVVLDRFGTAKLDVPLKEDAKVGDYTLTGALGGKLIVRAFRVDEYRVPTFAVEVASDEPWIAGSPGHAAITASYLHGGPLAGREVRWEVSRAPELFAPKAFTGFVFDAALGSARGPESLSHGTSRLDGQGHLVVAVKPDHGTQAGPMRYTVDAAVADVDRQVYAGKLARVVHPAEFYVGLGAPVRRVVSAGDTIAVPIVAVAPDGTARAGVDVVAALERVDYHGVTRVGEDGAQRLARPVPAIERRCAVTTRATAVECRFVVAAAGSYVVRATASDTKRRGVEAAFALSASGGTAVAWPRFDHERIAVVADKPSYRPGDVARLVVQSPFPEARGLLTLERDGVIEHRLFTIDGDTPELRVPITDAAVPNLYASVVLIRGRVHDLRDATGFETGAPAFRIGYTELHVEPRAYRLDVAVKPEAAKAYPGSTVGVDIDVRDASGKPRAAQATVMVVDEAVLGLTRYRTPDPIADLFTPRALAVRTGESRLEMLNARRSRRERVFPAGDGGPGDGSEQAESKPPDELGDLRKLFRSTAYYNADVAVGPDGHAHVAVALPDNVTTYRIMAVAVDDEIRAGSGQAGLSARKPVIVQPALPRFVHPGDHLRLEARVFNGTDAKGTVEVASTLAGMVLDGGAATATADAAANGEATVKFPVVIPDDARGEATVRFVARLGGYRDAVEVKLPILDPGSRRSIVATKLVTGREALALAIPAGRRPGTVKLELLASTTALAELKGAVDYLMTYPNGCIEQTTSTAYPLVVLHDLLPEMGVTVDEAQLKKYSEAGVKRILSFQTTSGGLAYWPGSDAPHAFATAFGLTALIEAKHKGYDVPDAALARMADFLETSLRQDKITGEMPHGGMADADTRAFFVLTLGRLGRPQHAYVSTLWQHRDQLTPFGLAFLGVAVGEGAGDRALQKPILEAVRAAATEQPREAWYEGNAKGGWSFDSPLRTHAGALLAYAAAGTATDGTMGAKLLAGLLARQRGGMWGNTQENVFGIMAVARLAKASPDKPSFGVTINGKPIDAAQIHDVTGNLKRLVLDGAAVDTDKLVIEITNGGKPVYATARVDYVATLDAANRAPRAAGFTVNRRYETAGGDSLEGKHVRLGSLVRVRLAVHASAANHYVAIADNLPAGLEPLNTALATTETVAAGKPSQAATRALGLLSYSELRDARVGFYIDDMPAGDYELVYVARATTPGTFIRPAANAEAMYAPEVSGASAIDELVVE